MNYYIVGCGGVCTYFLPSFLKTLKHHKALKKSEVTLVDGDKIEQKNYDRQMFRPDGVGQYKSEVLRDQYSSQDYITRIQALTDYVTDSFFVEPKSMIIGFVDNHPARKDLLAVADRSKSAVIFAANSEIGAHAYFYDPAWAGSELDPRVRYPELLTVERGSPVHAAGCTSDEKLDETPQTAIANQFAASHALHLWNFWNIESKRLPEDTFKFWPLETKNSYYRCETIAVGDVKQFDE